MCIYDLKRRRAYNIESLVQVLCSQPPVRSLSVLRSVRLLVLKHILTGVKVAVAESRSCDLCVYMRRLCISVAEWHEGYVLA